MLHHVDVHVNDLATAELFDAIAPFVGYRRLPDEPDFVGYETGVGGRPRIGFVLDADHRSGSMRLAFAVESRHAVDDAARVARECEAHAIEGPGLNPEYGDDYYAVFFDDAGGNKYEIVVDATAFPRRG